jgi:hypothetical protein
MPAWAFQIPFTLTTRAKKHGQNMKNSGFQQK